MFTHTRAVATKIVKDLMTLSMATDLVLQALLIVLTGYNIFANVGDTVKLAIYVVLLVISAVWFVYSIGYYRMAEKTKEKKENKKSTALAIKCVKLLIRLFIVIYSIVNVFLVESSTFSYIIAFTSLGSLIIQIFTAIFSYVIGNYISLLEVAFNEDMKPYQEMKDTVKNIYEKVTHPVYEISNTFLNRINGVKEENEEVPIDKKIEERLNKVKEIREEFLVNKEAKEEQEKSEKQQRDEEFNEHKKEVIDEFKNTLKEFVKNKVKK